jgi:hypothetical protein
MEVSITRAGAMTKVKSTMAATATPRTAAPTGAISAASELTRAATMTRGTPVLGGVLITAARAVRTRCSALLPADWSPTA